MIDVRFVYIMIRTKEDEAKIILCLKMLNALKVEKKLHKIFEDSRFKMTKKIRYRKWFQYHVKIGIAKDPKTRRLQVTKDITKSGKTEWFAMTPLELIFLCAWLHWYSLAFKIIMLFTLLTSLLTFFIYYQLL